MVLTFTGSLSVAEAGREDVRTMLIGALGCNVAWGVIDAVFYLMGCLADTGRRHAALVAARAAQDAAEARRHVAAALPPLVVQVLQPAELDSIRARVSALPAERIGWGRPRCSCWCSSRPSRSPCRSC
jgi:hypothetical protein